MVCSWLALSLHVLSKIIWVLHSLNTKRLYEQLLRSELWLQDALPPLRCLLEFFYRFPSTVTHHTLKDSFLSFLASPLWIPSLMTALFHLVASPLNIISSHSDFIIPWTDGWKEPSHKYVPGGEAVREMNEHQIDICMSFTSCWALPLHLTFKPYQSSSLTSCWNYSSPMLLSIEDTSKWRVK